MDPDERTDTIGLGLAFVLLIVILTACVFIVANFIP
jgi:hypothetical protein